RQPAGPLHRGGRGGRRGPLALLRRRRLGHRPGDLHLRRRDMSMMERSDPAVSKARLRLWLRLLAVTRMVEGELRERLRGLETTLPRFDVMAALSRAPDGLKMTELSNVLRVSNGNVTGIVDRL